MTTLLMNEYKMKQVEKYEFKKLEKIVFKLSNEIWNWFFSYD